jgi:hypothetical protein
VDRLSELEALVAILDWGLAPKTRAFLEHAARSFASLDVIRPWGAA